MDLFFQKAYAASTSKTSTADALLKKLGDNILTPIINLLMALAVVYFLWGMVQFIKDADNADKKKEGYQRMIWGVIGIFIMISAKGLINIIMRTLGA